MPQHETVTLKGTVADIFAQRFVLATSDGRVLADLTPRGADQVRLREGDEVEIFGERRPSEVKVMRVLLRDGRAIRIEHKPPRPERGQPPHHDRHSAEADSERALRGALREGFTTVSRPRRKPKHFELLARDEAGAFVELHVEFDGHIRKTRRVIADDPKWADEIGALGKRETPTTEIATTESLG
jgi:hypothetical protein